MATVFMMRDVLCGSYRAAGFENKKPIWASDRFRLRERYGSSPLRVTHIRAFARSTVAAPGPVG
jgi:hypothetical protein